MGIAKIVKEDLTADITVIQMVSMVTSLYNSKSNTPVTLLSPLPFIIVQVRKGRFPVFATTEIFSWFKAATSCNYFGFMTSFPL